MAFHRFISLLTQSLYTSSLFSVILEVLSSLQILHVIFQTMAHFSTENHLVGKILSRSLQFFATGFVMEEYTKQKIIIHSIWLGCALYLTLYLLLFLFLFILHTLKKAPNNWLLKILSLNSIVHSKVLFFPIQSFFISFINLKYNTSCSRNAQLYCQTGWLVGTICLCVINFSLALVKEFVFYQIIQTKDPYACKTNLYHQITLLYKTISLILILDADNLSYKLKANSLLLLGFNAGLLYILYTKLPFYRFRILRIIVITNALSFSLSILSVIQAFVTNLEVLNGIQMILPIIPFIGVKLALIRFQALFEWIFKSRYLPPEYAIHFGLLLEAVILKERNSLLYDKCFFPNVCSISGVLAQKDIILKNLEENSKENSTEKQRLYEFIIQKIELNFKRHPDSQILMLFLAHIYIKKLKNFAKALEILKKLSTMKPSIHALISIENLYQLLRKKRRQKENIGKNMLGVDKVLKFKELTELLKLKIQNEIKLHLEFWNNLRGGTLDVKTTIDQAEEIEGLFTTINREFHKDHRDFQTNFQLPILMYSIYLKVIRHLPNEAILYFNRFRLHVSNLTPNNKFNFCSETTAIVIISLESTKAGQIIDTTEAIQDLFGLKKNEIIGLNFGCFFPHIFAKTFQHEILDCISVQRHKLNKKYKTYGKTSNGRIFELEAHFQFYVHAGDDNRAIIALQRISTNQPLLIVDYEGVIVDYSKDLEELFEKENLCLYSCKKIQDIALELVEANKAYNVLYNHYHKDFTSSAFGKASEKLDDRRRTYISEVEDPLKNYSRVTIEETHVETTTNLFSTNRDEDTLILNSGKKESHRPLISSQGTKGFHSANFPTAASVVSKTISQNHLSIEKAKQLYQTYTRGKRITLSSRKEEDILRGTIQIKKYILGGNLYKIVRISDVKKEEICSDASEDDSQSNQNEGLHCTFGDEFPMENEKKIQGQNEPKCGTQNRDKLTSIDKTHSILFVKTEEKKHNNLEIIFGSSNDTTCEEKNHQFSIRNKLHLQDPRDLSLDYTYKEQRFIKTMKEIAISKKLFPQLKYLIIIIFLVFLLVLSMAGATFSMSWNSIIKVEKGVKIVNYATESLVDIAKTWGWVLFLFSSAIGIGVFPADTLEVLRRSVEIDILHLSESNKAMRELLSNLDAKDFLANTFAKNIIMYNPLVTGPLGKEELNIFSATDYLIPKYLSMSSYTNILQLTQREDLLFNLNNTANDYMLKSSSLIVQTDEFLQDLISQNLKTLRIMLILQSLLLTFLIILIIFIPFIVLKAYKKFFQTLINLKMESIDNQIYQLNKVQTFFTEEGIQFRELLRLSYEFLEGTRENIYVKDKGYTPWKKNKSFSTQKMDFYLLKFTIISLLFIPILIGLFCGSLLGSMSSFRSFEEVKNQMSVLGEAMYEANMLVNSFAYGVLFMSQPAMLIHNMPPQLQLAKSLQIFSGINNRLTHVFLQKENLDPDVVNVLKSDVCSYLTLNLQNSCAKTTKEGLNGLLSVNADYLQTAIFYFNQYQENPTLQNIMLTSAQYISITSPILLTLNHAYRFLIDHILEKFDIIVHDTLNNERSYFIGVCLTIFLSKVFIYFVLIKKLVRIDLTRRKILKIIPFDVLQDNKILVYYLQNSFGREVENIKNLL